jgi:hypothetical protein
VDDLMDLEDAIPELGAQRCLAVGVDEREDHIVDRVVIDEADRLAALGHPASQLLGDGEFARPRQAGEQHDVRHRGNATAPG